MGAAVGGLLGFGLLLGKGPLLACLGFGAHGIIAGSSAAAWQAGFGGFIASGGLFATLQSVAMGGLSWAGWGATLASSALAGKFLKK